ncbi:MAG: hypothetical protein ACLR23_04940 [Clostridia bacterium]
MLKSIQVAKFRQMIIAGANRLEEHKHSVDELNVFRCQWRHRVEHVANR